MIAVFLHPIGWGAKRVIVMCGADSEAFYPSECSIGKIPSSFDLLPLIIHQNSIGWSLYCAVVGIILCFICAGISLKAETSNMHSNVKRRIESGERLVCVP